MDKRKQRGLIHSIATEEFEQSEYNALLYLGLRLRKKRKNFSIKADIRARKQMRTLPMRQHGLLQQRLPFSLTDDIDMDKVASQETKLDARARTQMATDAPPIGTVKVMTRIQAKHGVTDHTNDHIVGFLMQNLARKRFFAPNCRF